MRYRQTGFTIIELIVVIALLGILSAVALPRFINVTDEAHNAAVEGAAAGFSTGVALLKAQAVANGDLGVVTADVSGYGDEILDINAGGYPVGIDGGNVIAADSDCVDLWTALFANGPVVSTAPPSAGNGVDYHAQTGGNAPGNGCEYEYKSDPDNRYITYAASTGIVTTVIH